MWFLKSNSSDEVYYIKPNTSYLVGCKNCEIILKDDKSISRKHATISNENETITLIDSGSKYGTYLNENIAAQNRIEPKVEILIQENDVIKFGLLQNEWVLAKQTFVTCPSTVQIDSGEIAEHLKELGVKTSSAWTTECTHLTMPAITLTMKVVLALSHLRPIVVPSFWTECVSCYRNNLPMPQPKDFLPENKESSINQMSVNFDKNPVRSQLFDGKTFIFFSQPQLNSYSQLIKAAKGKCVVLDECKMSTSELLSLNVAIVQPVKKGSTQDSELQYASEVVELLSAQGLRCIPEAEIGLAVLYASMEKYCNPAFHIASQITKKDDKVASKKDVVVLAPESQDFSQESFFARPKRAASKIVDETIDTSLSGRTAMTSQGSSKLSFQQSTNLTAKKPQVKDNTFALSKRPLSPEFKEPPRKKQLVLTNRRDLPSTSRSSAVDDDELFNFIEDKDVTKKKKSPVENLLSMPQSKRRRTPLTCDDGDLFDFSSDVSDGRSDKKSAATGQLKLMLPNKDKPSASMEGSLKRKEIDSDIPKSKRSHLDVAAINKNNDVVKRNSGLKIDVSKCAWKSCKEYAQRVKNESVEKKEESVEASTSNEDIEEKLSNLTLKKAIVVMNDSLIKRHSIYDSIDAVDHSTSRQVNNFKKFVKVQPKRPQTSVFAKKDFSVFESRPKNNTQFPIENNSSDDEPERDEFEFMASLSRGSKSLTLGKQTRRL